MTAKQKARAEAIGKQIVSARKRKGMSQVALSQALAERSGLDAETVRRSLVNNETGKYAPRVHTLQAISEITEQPIDYFLAEVGEATAPFRGDRAA